MHLSSRTLARLIAAPLAVLGFNAPVAQADAPAPAPAAAADDPDGVGAAAGARAAAEAEAEATGPSSLRIRNEPGQGIALEISIRDFAPTPAGPGHPVPEGPIVSLVGVTHIGDADYYAELERLLAEYDVVLYESVAPSGAAGAGGATPVERMETSLATARFLGRSAAMKSADTGVWPPTPASLVQWYDERDPRLADFLERATVDAWDRPYAFLRGTGIDADAEASMIVRSLGADGVPGGRGPDADIHVTVTAEDREAIQASSEAAASAGPGIQAELADALGLAYQLAAMDYDRDNFVPSDMAIDEVNRAMAERGGSLEFLETLEGGNLPARVARVMLGVVKFADRLSGGAASTAMKVMLVEMLGDEAMVDMSLAQVDPALGEVIVGERNRRVMDDLARVLTERAAAGETDGRIAIFYGAAHMPDFEERLERRFGYAPVGEPRWLPAISVDFREAPVSEAQLNQIRVMVRRQLQMMQRMQQQGGAD